VTLMTFDIDHHSQTSSRSKHGKSLALRQTTFSINQVKVYNIKTGSHPISGVSNTNGNWALSTAIHSMGYTVHTLWHA
jgi:hypothetical protein